MAPSAAGLAGGGPISRKSCSRLWVKAGSIRSGLREVWANQWAKRRRSSAQGLAKKRCRSSR